MTPSLNGSTCGPSRRASKRWNKVSNRTLGAQVRAGEAVSREEGQTKPVDRDDELAVPCGDVGGRERGEKGSGKIGSAFATDLEVFLAVLIRKTPEATFFQS